MSNKKPLYEGQRALVVASNTYNADTHTVSVVYATGAPVLRYGWDEDFNEVLVCDAQNMRMERATGLGLPFLDSHNSYELKSQLGRCSNFRIESGQCVCDVQFSASERGKEVEADVASGIINSISVGYRVYKYDRIKPADNDKYATYNAIDWEPLEISAVAVPADIKSGIRSLTQKSNEMTEEEKKAAEAKVAEEKRAADAKAAEDKAAQIKAAEEKRAADAKAAEDAAAQARSAQSATMQQVLEVTRAAHFDDAEAVKLFERNLSLDAVRTEVIELLAKKNAPIDGSVSLGEDSADKKRDAAINALMHRAIPSKVELEAGNTYRGLTMVEMVRSLYEDRGRSTRGMTANELWQDMRRAISTGDFPDLFEALIDRSLQPEYLYEQESWDRVSRQESVNDFREHQVLSFESVNGMSEIAEGGEIKYTKVVQSKERLRLKSFGEGIRYTRQAFINDDLTALNRLPMKLARDWDELRGDVVWDIFTAGKLADGKGIFDASHNNIGTGATSALSIAGLTAAITMFRKQTGIDGKRRIQVAPKTIVVPVELEAAARALLFTISPNKTEDVNIYANAGYNLIVERRLLDPTAWYLIADPQAIEGIAYAYLSGAAGLRSMREEKFNTDTVDYAVRGDFGAAAIDYRGMVKMSGK